MKLYLKIFLLVIAIKSYSQCTGALVGYFPATVNGVTITESIMGAVGAGSPNPANTYTYCGVICIKAKNRREYFVSYNNIKCKEAALKSSLFALKKL
jgi:hypothetical protein